MEGNHSEGYAAVDLPDPSPAGSHGPEGHLPFSTETISRKSTITCWDIIQFVNGGINRYIFYQVLGN